MLKKKEQEFEDFYHEHFNFVYNFAFSYLYDKDMVEDVVQEVFFTAYRKYDSLLFHVNVRGWLVNTTKNLAHKSARKVVEAEQDGIYFDDTSLLELAFHLISERDYLFILDRYARRYAPQQIASKHGMTVNAVCLRLCRIRAKLRMALEQEGGSKHEEE